MKVLVFLGVLFACGAALQMAASAQKVYEFCMESADGAGGATINCSYESMAQCLASKGGPADRCFANPRLGGRR